MTSDIKKIEVPAVAPTALSHHRELPAGRYHQVLSGFGTNLYLIRSMATASLHLIEWNGKANFRDDFEVTEDGGLATYTFGRPEESYPG